MNDLVERLHLHDDPRLYMEADDLMAEAADEIIRLRVQAGDFQMAYRMKCDAETKSQAEEIARLRAELERLKTVPMKYRRMEFNAQLQEENSKLRAEVELMRADAQCGLKLHSVIVDIQKAAADNNDLRVYELLRAAIDAAMGAKAMAELQAEAQKREEY